MSECKNTVAALRLTAGVAEKRIRDIAKVSGHVILSNHARERMVEREFFDSDVLRVLRTGYVDGAPALTGNNEWPCKITSKIREGRTGGVVTIILHSGKLFVKTVEWEDLS